MLVDGREYAILGDTVIKLDGREINITANTDPSENDVKMVRYVWRTSRNFPNPPTSTPNPPTFEEAQSDPCLSRDDPPEYPSPPEYTP